MLSSIGLSPAGEHVPSVLIVDDNPQIRKLLGAFLGALEGVRICGEAVDGLDAIAKCCELTPDLVVLDFAMPRMNGLEAARKLRSMNIRAQIVLFTLYADQVTPLELDGTGISTVFSKGDVDGLMKHILSTARSL